MINDFELIYSYTRADAIADGLLINVSDLAKQTGFTVPVALSDRVYLECVSWSDDDTTQDEAGRLWDVLTMAMHAARGAIQKNSDTAEFIVKCRHPIKGLLEDVPLRMQIHGGDNHEPVITIMMPNED
jgi:hypothetical protein